MTPKERANNLIMRYVAAGVPLTKTTTLEDQLRDQIAETINAGIQGERERCLALLKLEQESAQEAKLNAGVTDYIDGWIDALARLKVKFKDKTDE